MPFAQRDHMIVSNQLPSPIWGHTSTSIHSSGFDCVILTARRRFISRCWQTTILSGDPAKNCPIRPYGSFYYFANLTRDRVLAVHSDVAEIINELAEQGATLAQAFDRVTLHLAIQRFIQKEIRIHEDSPEER
jgi:hypothetical protein